MGLKSTLLVDGREVEKGSVEAVELFRKELRDAEEHLANARTALSACPREVQDVWEKRLTMIGRSLTRLIRPVEGFARDFFQRGLASAIEDAKFRKEL